MDSVPQRKTLPGLVLLLLSVIGLGAGQSGDLQEGIDSIVKANNQFCLELYANLTGSEKGNIFISPYSITTALGMVYEGARGQTAQEIQSVFHFPEDNEGRRKAIAGQYEFLNKKESKYKLNTANALWVQRDYKLQDEYINTIEKYYSGKAVNVDFLGATEQSRVKINKWVEDRTNNKIKDLFPPNSLSPLTRLVLTNAIYFKGTWVRQFDKKETRKEDFILSDGNTVLVPMMKRTDEDARFRYAETDEMQVLEMDYEGQELCMIVLLPKGNELQTLEESLTVAKLDQWKSNLREQRVRVFLPKFTFTTKYTLNDNLRVLGMPLAFSEAADLSGIDGTKSLFIQVVVHQAFVDLNEEGTEAAAATGVAVGTTSVPPPVPVFRADHPFIFMILEKDTGNILFFGRMCDPR